MGVYHIRCENDGYLLERETGGIFVEMSSKKGLFRLSHNDDGTISLFSLTLNKYLDSDIHFKRQDKIAKFELRSPKKLSADGTIVLALGMKFLCVSKFGHYFEDEDDQSFGKFFTFEPVKA